MRPKINRNYHEQEWLAPPKPSKGQSYISALLKTIFILSTVVFICQNINNKKTENKNNNQNY